MKHYACLCATASFIVLQSTNPALSDFYHVGEQLNLEDTLACYRPIDLERVMVVSGERAREKLIAQATTFDAGEAPCFVVTHAVATILAPSRPVERQHHFSKGVVYMAKVVLPAPDRPGYATAFVELPASALLLSEVQTDL